jgi:nucleotide-binding universal stress UspA family protein
MTYQDILVYLDDQRGAETRLNVAVSLASQSKAHIVGLYGFALPEAPRPLAVAGGYVDDNALMGAFVRERDAAFDRERQVEARFHAATGQAGLPSDWETCQKKAGDLAALVTERARYADLAVLGQADAAHPFSDALAKLPETVMLGSGRPVLIVPYAGRIDRVGTRVFVAWSGTREAARAVADAIPMLRDASAVTIASIGSLPGAEHNEGRLVADVARHLAQHGIRARTEHFTVPDIETGEVILSRAADLDCDLIVMGGYGHSRTRELILGGVTRTILRYMTMPVIMSH